MSLLTNLNATVVQANQGYVNLPDPRPLYPSFAQRQGPLYSSPTNMTGVIANVALSFEGQTMAHVYLNADTEQFQVTFYWRGEDGNYGEVMTVVPSPQQSDGDPLQIALSADGNVCVVGNPESITGNGSVYIYRKVSTGSSPSQFTFVDTVGRLVSSPFSSFGCSVAIAQVPQQQDYTIAVGSAYLNAEDSTGEVVLFRLQIRSSTNIFFTNPQTIKINLTEAPNFGFAVALNSTGTILATSDPFYQSGLGGVWLFTKSSVTEQFEQMGGVLQPSGAFKTSLTEVRAGFSLSLSGTGTTLSVGCPYDRTTQGTVVIYYIDPVAQIADQGPTITPVELAVPVLSFIGTSQKLSADGNTLLIGSTNAQITSSIWVYNRLTRAQWLPNGGRRFAMDAETSSAVYDTGIKVALSGNGQVAAAIALIPMDEVPEAFFPGTVFVFA